MTETQRERIAKIIDPLFDHHEPHLPEWEAFGDRQRAIALEKADQILAEIVAEQNKNKCLKAAVTYLVFLAVMNLWVWASLEIFGQDMLGQMMGGLCGVCFGFIGGNVFQCWIRRNDDAPEVDCA